MIADSFVPADEYDILSRAFAPWSGIPEVRRKETYRYICNEKW